MDHWNARTNKDGFCTLLSVWASAVLYGVLIACPHARADDQVAASLLFSNGTGGLSVEDQHTIVGALELRVSADGKQLIDSACEQPVTVNLTFTDMNGDGVSEVVVNYGNACMSGMAGSSVAVFIRDASRYRLNLGLPGMVAETMASKNEGYHNLLIGGPGFCFPVWQWNGKEYAYLRNEPQSPGGCDRR